MKRLQSQWEFEELLPPAATRKVVTVSDLTSSIRSALEREVGTVWVTGEISNFRSQSSGHSYFSLKDADAQLACVLFRGDARFVNRDYLQDGKKVVLHGEITVYAARGQYQLRVLQVELQGIGALQAAFEQLKQKLNAEGLFGADRKRPLPAYPSRMGMVTSSSGAALRDVLHVIARRDPSLQVVLASCRVQGQGAGEEIACAIQLLNEWSEDEQSQGRAGLDLILVTRGGGSLEDLWAFNEEVVARAVYGSRLPVVSAVGHEIDFTIIDFVADLRAATPSAAAELITEGVFACRAFVEEAPERIAQLMRGQLAKRQQGLGQLGQRLLRCHPRRRFQEQAQRVDDLQETLSRCGRRAVATALERWRNLAGRLGRIRPVVQVGLRRQQAADLWIRSREALELGLQNRNARLGQAAEKLRLLSPDHVLRRGYSITMLHESGRVVRRAEDVPEGALLRTRLAEGEITSERKNAGKD